MPPSRPASRPAMNSHRSGLSVRLFCLRTATRGHWNGVGMTPRNRRRVAVFQEIGAGHPQWETAPRPRTRTENAKQNAESGCAPGVRLPTVRTCKSLIPGSAQ